MREEKMSNWETCEIERVIVREYKEQFFGFSSTPALYKYVAKSKTTSGPRIVAESSISEAWGPIHDELIAHLASEGWEAVSFDSVGRAVIMRRRIENIPTRDTTHATTNPTDLIQQLANLRAAGILTEQEFQTKKAEILKRM